MQLRQALAVGGLLLAGDVTREPREGVCGATPTLARVPGAASERAHAWGTDTGLSFGTDPGISP